jgi:hypothetical protein
MHDGGGDTERDAMGRSERTGVVPGCGGAVRCVEPAGRGGFYADQSALGALSGASAARDDGLRDALPGWVVAAWGLGVWGSLAGLC